MQHQRRLLLDGLDRNEAHARSRQRLADRRRIGCVIFLTSDIRLHVARRHQPHRVAKLGQLTRPVSAVAHASMPTRQRGNFRKNSIIWPRRG